MAFAGDTQLLGIIIIDIIGVMPEPAEINRNFFAELLALVNRPAGPSALIRLPGRRLSSIQRVPILSR